ncbi:glycosyltransferase family 2 protein [Kitasatospora sp. NPDC059571]|uniref:glycosyltransferase family 2 protein n=1 Tax=Kitasatospora sp. NPDC059571 TaxID=3346871 RepID=UPI00368436D8
MTVKVTVVVPTHDCGPRYWATLASLRDQTMASDAYEVILVDDGSTDGTPDTLRGDTAFTRNITVVEAEHSGSAGRPRNLGLEAARGEYVLFVDDHDRIAPDALERLYDKAVQCDADIVVPRTAGHGRTVPRDVFAAPMERGHLVADPVLLQSLTPHKLFRRSFLDRHGLRFPEGPVPLADEYFTLRAHLAARSVAVLHDRTCYHWVRDEARKAAPAVPLADHVRSAASLIELVQQQVAPGPAQDALVARLYQDLLLDRLDARVLKLNDAAMRTRHQEIGALVQARIAPSVDRHLPAGPRVRSAVLRSGRPADLQTLARHEAVVTHQTRITSAGWRDGRLALRVSSLLVRQDRAGERTAVRFVLDGDRIRWDLPAPLLALPGVAEAADVTAELPATGVRAHARPREEAWDLYLETADHRASTVALGHGAAGLPLVAVQADATVLLDPAALDHGSPVTGLWDLSAVLDSCGWARARRIGEDRSPLADTLLRPAFLADGTFVAPYWTKNGNISVRIAPGTLAGLRTAVREPDRILIAEAGGVLRVRVPLDLAPAPGPVPVTVELSAGDGGEPLRVAGEIAPDRIPGQAVLDLAAAVPAAPGPLALAVGVLQDGRTTRAADLGIRLGRTAAGHWTAAAEAV